MRTVLSSLVLCIVAGQNALSAPPRDEAAPQTPRIAWVAPIPNSALRRDTAEIWSDDFDNPELRKSYFEVDGETSTAEALGGTGSSMRLHYPKGKQGSASRKLVFGDCPFGRPLRNRERFNEVYWRFYLFHPQNWRGGGPDKLTRATGFVSDKWNQAFILHVWDEKGGLTLDPASGVKDGSVITTKYNDFDHLRWLGNQPASGYPFYTEEVGRWVAVEVQLRLNTPGKADGYSALWIDGELRAERKQMDFRGIYNGHSINAIFLEAYWNNGSPVDQSRFIDNFVVSAKPIGPIVARANPEMQIRTDPGAVAWQVEVAQKGSPQNLLWRSNTLTGTIFTVTAESGKFLSATRKALPSGTYTIRVRQQGDDSRWSNWSEWHQPFRVQ